jgi:hypothetical protein
MRFASFFQPGVPAALELRTGLNLGPADRVDGLVGLGLHMATVEHDLRLMTLGSGLRALVLPSAARISVRLRRAAQMLGDALDERGSGRSRPAGSGSSAGRRAPSGQRRTRPPSPRRALSVANSTRFSGRSMKIDT